MHLPFPPSSTSISKVANRVRLYVLKFTFLQFLFTRLPLRFLALKLGWTSIPCKNCSKRADVLIVHFENRMLSKVLWHDLLNIYAWPLWLVLLKLSRDADKKAGKNAMRQFSRSKGVLPLATWFSSRVPKTAPTYIQYSHHFECHSISGTQRPRMSPWCYKMLGRAKKGSLFHSHT